jgi:iron complex outermembrane receptor protein
MKSSKFRSESRQSGRLSVCKMSPVAAGCTVLLLVAAQAAQAQQATTLDTVTVTGIRKAIEDAVATKKNASSIVEAISAEDIGKLPDPSVADSISRLPGVAAQSNKGSGKAQQISVRGMSPDFNGATLNGREVASSGDSRGVDFDLYPAELLSSVLVYKTPHASLVGQGLSSTIDLRTVRPLDFKKRAAAINYRDMKTGIKNGVPNGEGSGERMSLSYIDQFADRKIGVALGFVHFKENGAAQPRANTWGGWTPELDYNGQKVKVPGGFGRDTELTVQERDGAMAVLQFKPNENFESVLDIFYSKGSQAFQKKGIEGFIGGDSGGSSYRGVPKLLTATVANGFATSGTVDNFKAVIRNHNEGTDDKLEALGWNNRFKFGDWTGVVDLGQSKVTKVGARYETTAGLPGNGQKGGKTDTISWTNFDGSNFNDIKFTPGLNYADPNVAKLTDVMGWGGGEGSPQAGYVASPTISDKIDNLRLSGKRAVEWGLFNAVEIGVNALTRNKVSSTQEGFLVINGSSDPYASVVAPGAGVTTAGASGIPVMTWDPRGSLGSVYSLRSNLYGTVINRNWSVKEEVTTGFLKGELDGTLFGMPYSGNVGAQFVNTDQSSGGFTNDSGSCTGKTPETCKGLTGGKSFTDVLPSVNLALELGNDQIMRLGVGKTLSRPKMGDMRASMDAPSVNNSLPVKVLRATGGNPELEPFRATAFDLSYEKYFGSKGYVSVAGFYKDLNTYILTLGREFDFKNYLTPNTVLPPNGSTVGILTQPINGSGGTIRGIEMAVNIPLSLLAKPLDGFGVSVNHSDTKSSIKLPTSAFPNASAQIPDIPLPGLSRKVTNLRFYYEKHGIQFAVAQRKRSDFLGEVTDYKDDKEITFIKGESVVDLQLGYEFQRGWFKGLSVLFQANNIGDAKFQQYTTDPSKITDTKVYGRTYMFGLNYKL